MGLEKPEMKEAELLIKQRDREKDSELFYEIEHLDLLQKTFGFIHKNFRKDFTRSKKSSNSVSCIFLPKNSQNISCIHIRIMWRWRMALFFRVQKLKLPMSSSHNYAFFPKMKR